jgi:hypothetical protein
MIEDALRHFTRDAWKGLLSMYGKSIEDIGNLSANSRRTSGTLGTVGTVKVEAQRQKAPKGAKIRGKNHARK